MNVLVTGATGFIGKHLVNRLLADGHNVYCTILKEEKSPFDQHVKTLNFWEQDPQTIIDFFRNNSIDGIIHLASIFLSEHKTDDVQRLIDANVKFGALLLELAAQATIKWFINTGTFWQHYQDADYSPVNLYAATKQAFECIAQYYIETNQIKFCTLCLSDTYGPDDTRPKIFNLWEKIAKSGEPLDMSPGDQLIDISYIDDIIEAYILLMNQISEKEKTKENGSVFAVKAEKRYTLKELAKIFEKATNQKLNINWGARPYKGKEVMVPWSGAQVVPGWSAKISFEEGIRRLIL
jgi:nucleoside-diphosphate-sugar epimerase